MKHLITGLVVLCLSYSAHGNEKTAQKLMSTSQIICLRVE